jgi:hypothetical protein
MGLKYRWMQKKDLDKVSETKKDFEILLNNNRTVANVVEFEDSILGYIIYKILKDKIKVIKVVFSNDDILDFIIEKIKKKSKLIEMPASEYDLDLHLLLKSKNFLATRIEKNQDQDEDFYIFELRA